MSKHCKLDCGCSACRERSMQALAYAQQFGVAGAMERYYQEFYRLQQQAKKEKRHG